MGSSAIAVRQESGDTDWLDRPAVGADTDQEDISLNRSFPLARDGQVLPTAELPCGRQATPRASQEEVALDQLWFALSSEEQLQFGSHFSQMLLKAARQIITSFESPETR